MGKEKGKGERECERRKGKGKENGKGERERERRKGTGKGMGKGKGNREREQKKERGLNENLKHIMKCFMMCPYIPMKTQRRSNTITSIFGGFSNIFSLNT